MPIIVCMSGAASEDTDKHYTLCRSALKDNDMDDPEAEYLSCRVATAAARVSDGCYDDFVWHCYLAKLLTSSLAGISYYSFGCGDEIEDCLHTITDQHAKANMVTIKCAV